MRKHLKVFLSYGSEDEKTVRELYQRLREEGVYPWFDREKLIPGQEWDLEIRKAIRDSDAILVCLSSSSVRKEGYVQKELKQALDIAEEKPEGTIFIIPVKLDPCDLPSRLQTWQWVDWDTPDACDSIIRALRSRASELNTEHLPGSGPLVQTINPTNESGSRVIYRSADVRELLRRYQDGILTEADVPVHPPTQAVAITNEALSEILSPYHSDLRKQEVKNKILALVGICSPYREWQEVTTKNHCFRNESEYESLPDEIDRTPVHSSNVASIGYDKHSQILEVEFHNGSIYHYFKVPEYLFDGLMGASSHGKYLNVHIKPEYAYEQV